MSREVILGSKARERILAEAKLAAIRFLVYDRRDDEELPVGVIQEAYKAGDITTGEIVGAFIDGIEETWGD